MVRFRKRRRAQSIVGAPMRYMTARMKWEAAGKPVRSDKEVERIHEKLCQPCEHYRTLKSGYGWCAFCKCSLNLGKDLSKILWATESCPDNPPKWKAEVEVEEPIKKTGTARRENAVPVQRELQREIIQQMTPEERLAEHERRKLERREARRLAVTRDTEDTPGA